MNLLQKLQEENILDVLVTTTDGRVIDVAGNDITARPDVAAIIAAHDPTTEAQQKEIAFDLPLRAPSITVDDIFVESRDIKDDPDEAFAEALAEGRRGKGKAKSIDLIVRSMLRKMERQEEEIKQLKKDIKRLEKA